MRLSNLALHAQLEVRRQLHHRSMALTKAVLRYCVNGNSLQPAFVGWPLQPRNPGHQPLSVELDLPELLSRDELSEEGDTLFLSFSRTSRILVLTSSLLTKSCYPMPMILRWHLTWNASSCFASACRMVQVSEPYKLTSACRKVLVSEAYILVWAYRMFQVSQPCRHIDLAMHAYATLTNSEFWRQGETHLAPSTTEVAHCSSCQADQMHYVSFAISMRRLLWLEIGAHVKSMILSAMFPSTLIDASSGPVSRFWTFVFCQETWEYYWQQINIFLGQSPRRYLPH